MAAKSAASSDLLLIASKKWPYVGLFNRSGHSTRAREALPMVARMCRAPLCTCNGSKLSCKHLFSLCSTSRTRRMFGHRSMALPSMSADFRLRSSSLPKFGENATDSRLAINLLIWWWYQLEKCCLYTYLETYADWFAEINVLVADESIDHIKEAVQFDLISTRQLNLLSNIVNYIRQYGAEQRIGSQWEWQRLKFNKINYYLFVMEKVEA